MMSYVAPMDAYKQLLDSFSMLGVPSFAVQVLTGSLWLHSRKGNSVITSY